MLGTSNLITLPFSSDLTQAGIVSTCRSLAHTHNYKDATRFRKMRSDVAQVAVELAFRRYLIDQKIPHKMDEVMPFSKPGHQFVSLGGRRCDLIIHILTNKTEIRQIRRNPEIILKEHALLPSENKSSEQLTDFDIYIFTYLTALVTPDQKTIRRATAAYQPIHLIRPFPENWAQPKRWASMGRLAFKNESTLTLEVEIGGQRGDQGFQTKRFKLDSGDEIEFASDFHTLIYAHISDMPDGHISIHNDKFNETHVISPQHWGNIWVYGMDIIFTGYITRKDYHQLSFLHSAKSDLTPYSYHDMDMLALPISQLHPLSKLFYQTKQWAKQRAS